MKSPRRGRCPNCNTPAGQDNAWRPFCSERCKLSDLGQWFAGRYAIPAEDDDTPPELPQDPQSRQ